MALDFSRALPTPCWDTACALWLAPWGIGTWGSTPGSFLFNRGVVTKLRPFRPWSANLGGRASLLPPACIGTFAMVDWLQEHTFCIEECRADARACPFARRSGCPCPHPVVCVRGAAPGEPCP